ncbi:hypothetical protein AOLI_G00092890 [Acnodon oligacanthus]
MLQLPQNCFIKASYQFPEQPSNGSEVHGYSSPNVFPLEPSVQHRRVPTRVRSKEHCLLLAAKAVPLLENIRGSPTLTSPPLIYFIAVLKINVAQMNQSGCLSCCEPAVKARLRLALDQP